MSQPEAKKQKMHTNQNDLDCEVTGAFNHATGKAGSSVSSHRLLVLSFHPRGFNQNLEKLKQKSYSPESIPPSRWERE